MGNDRSARRKKTKRRGGSPLDAQRYDAEKTLGIMKSLYEDQVHRMAVLQEQVRVLHGIVMALLLEAGPVAVTKETIDALNEGTYRGWTDELLDNGSVLLTIRAKEEGDEQESDAIAGGTEDAEGKDPGTGAGSEGADHQDGDAG